MLTLRSSFPRSCSSLAAPSTGLDRLLDGLFAGPGFGIASPAVPQPMNVWQDADNIVVETELPGYSMEQIELTLTGRELVLKGDRTSGADDGDGKSWLRRERTSSSFARTVQLPAPVNADAVTAKLTDGVLTVTLPKAAEAKPRKISVA